MIEVLLHNVATMNANAIATKISAASVVAAVAVAAAVAIAVIVGLIDAALNNL